MDALVVGVSAAGGLVAGPPLEILAERIGAKEPLRPLRRPTDVRRTVALSVVGAAVLGGLAVRFGADVALAPFAVLALGLLCISAVDLERYLIPNRLVYPTLAVVAPLLVVSSAVDHRWGSLARAAIAGAAAFVAFFAVHLAVPKGMGFGDVRLAGVIGLATGWLGLGHAFVAFFAAFVLGAVIGIVVMAVGGGGRKTRIPFGPFLAAGAVVAWLWGNPVAHAIFHRGA
ncbi:MAG TPA: A24 family peptidase [Acidimicrobiales bacterium]|nr:A24 family peptidase [Acidimicrobiales bacterium]